MSNLIKGAVAKYEKFFTDLDKFYPNRYKEIHKHCCKMCPSEQDKIRGRLDPESEDIKTLPKEIIAKDHLFVCYARNSKLCKGLCDNMGIGQEYLDTKIYNNEY